MAGGIFGRPFVFNEKCIVFALLCMILFLYKPTFNNTYFLYFTLFIIFVVAYVGMAWYDYYFNCDLVALRRGKHSFTGLFKPPAHVPETQELNTKQKRKENNNDKLDKDKDEEKRHYIIYAMHLLFIVPLLLYIAYYKKRASQWIYPIIGVLAVFTAGYHGIALMTGSH